MLLVALISQAPTPLGSRPSKAATRLTENRSGESRSALTLHVLRSVYLSATVEALYRFR